MMIVDDDADRAWEHIVGRMAFQASDEELAEAEATLAEVEDAEPLSPRLIESIVAQAEGDSAAARESKMPRRSSWASKIAAAAVLTGILGLTAAAMLVLDNSPGANSKENLAYSEAMRTLRSGDRTLPRTRAALGQVTNKLMNAISTLRAMRDERPSSGLSQAAGEALALLLNAACQSANEARDPHTIAQEVEDRGLPEPQRQILVQQLASQIALGLRAIEGMNLPELEPYTETCIAQLRKAMSQ